MRANSICWNAAFLFGAICSAITAAEPTHLREPVSLAFTGVVSFPAADLRAALETNFDVTLAAHPSAPLTGYLRALESALELGYSHAGFKSARVEATEGDDQQQITVNVTEGPRHRCGPIKVSGAKRAEQARLVSSLAEPADKKAALWVSGHPAPFDAATTAVIRKQLIAAFEAQGFFATAFTVAIEAQSNGQLASLVIAIEDEGPRAVMDQITVTGHKRDSSADILNYLNLRPGDTYDSGLAERLTHRLNESGRFLGVRISPALPDRESDGPLETVPLQIELREYTPAPPLAAEFSPEQQVLLQVRDWATRWSRGEFEEDLVITAQLGSQKIAQFCADMDLPMPVEPSRIARAELKLVLAPNRGKIFALRLLGPDDRVILDDVLVLHRDRVMVASRLRQARLLLAGLGELQTMLTARIQPAQELDPETKPFTFTCGFSFKTDKHRDGLPLQVETELCPAALLYALEQPGSQAERVGDIWKISHDGVSAQFAAATGRPLELVLKTADEEAAAAHPASLTLRTEQGAFDRQSQELDREFAGAKEYGATAPWKSTLEFLLDEYRFISRQLDASESQIAATAALQKFLRAWLPPPLAEIWPVDPNRDQESDDPANPRFVIRWQDENWDWEDLKKPHSRSRKFVAAFSLPIYRRLVGSENWLWPLGRDILLNLASDSSLPESSLSYHFYKSELGPVGFLTLASLRNPQLTHSAIQSGQARLNSAGFRQDYEPLLAGDSWLSRWILSVVTAARSLDATDIEAIAQWRSLDEPTQQSVLRLFSVLKEDPDSTPADSLSRFLDALWSERLSDLVFVFFHKLQSQSNKSSEPLFSFRDDDKDPKTTLPQIPTGIDSPLADQLKALDQREQELKQQFSPNSSEKPKDDDTEIANRLKSLGNGNQKK